ncbi:hypothetical protein PFICI_13527 [Pestalotiopsis fici W106-1]|uniref:Uncharacterized protein n=1 Tax=Pestalotiopsis fici (strain W106-1 / CGMCC3.15140) TaxID=1229662 RepID=W3WME3_PESFW|nr:uncharacterized protein PFICI_13527 [Pestalotiopsis fici W106-1]ETS75043.1 hypothetical protein PFICI_13527 [Pestalotiopsis fici W106-1]
MESTGDTSSCSTAANTTDCLLDRLINIVSEKFAADDGKTDWDPITFAFTVPVGIFGILATLLALVAIIQGIFAASPGRRKSSHQVIGKWAEQTVTRVSLRELRTYTQASTPRLISDRLLNLLEMEYQAKIGNIGATTAVDQVGDGLLKTAGDNDNNGRIIANWLGEFQSLARRLPLCSKILSALATVLQTSSMPSAEAGWLQLLHQFELANLPLDTNDTAITAADYLPDDLKAVPAYADIRTIVVLAAVGGVKSFEPEIGSSYPLLIAPTFAIEFRQHPALGRVAKSRESKNMWQILQKVWISRSYSLSAWTSSMAMAKSR